jgi:phosphatidylserine decarboxylase
MLFKNTFGSNSGSSSDDSTITLLCQMLSWWYSIYSIYKALKKYKSLKYTVSITRNASRLAGYMCAMWLPKPLRYIMYGSFAKFYGINMKEVEVEDFGHYETFTKFFTRHLKKGVRPIHEPNNTKSMCSPCDGRVLTCGKINSEYSTIDCVKGRSYRLDEFMLGFQGEDHNNDNCQEDKTPNNSEIKSLLEKVKSRGNDLYYSVIYLSPADYHRFHSPAVHSGDYRRHIVGYLSPVKPSHVNKHKDVFKNNERVNIFGRWEQGFYFESAVGATNVGSIKLDFDEDVLTNRTVPVYPYFEDKNYVKGLSAEKASPIGKYLNSSEDEIAPTNKYKDSSLSFLKGEMTGRFEMGSTIVLIFEADSSTSLNIEEGQKLSLGEEIVSYKQKGE